MTSLLRVAPLLAALSAPFSAPLSAQAIAERALPPSQRTFAHEFTSAGSAVALASGSLIVGDMSETSLVFLDGETGSGRLVGRIGSGPLEFRSVGQLLQLPGDTVALYDVVQARLLLVSPTGVPVRTERWGADVMAAISRPQPFAIDKRGRVYGIQLPKFVPAQGMVIPDTLPVVRMASLTAAKTDTIAIVRQGQSTTTQPNMGADGKIHVKMPLAMLLPADEPVLLPDGRLIILRGDRYVVEWVSESGAPRVSAPVPSTRLPVTAADKRAIATETRALMETGMKAGARMLPAGQAMPELVVDEPETWPAQKPHFSRGSRAGTDGRLYVPVPCAAPAARCLDVLDAQAKRVARYKLPATGRLLAAGAGVIYVVVKDEDDLEFVHQHRIP